MRGTEAPSTPRGDAAAGQAAVPGDDAAAGQAAVADDDAAAEEPAVAELAGAPGAAAPGSGAPPLDEANVEGAIADIRAGRMVVVVDDEARENEGDLIMAAEHVTPEAINFMLRYGRGLLCMPLAPSEVQRLELPQMVERNEERLRTAFTVTIDARDVRTGISAAERAHTVRVAADPASRPEDLVRPGHVQPLRAQEGGVLRRPGHTEAAVDLATLAGLRPAAVLIEIMNEDGTMARMPELQAFARTHGLRLLTIAELVAYRRRREALVHRVAEAQLPTAHGMWRLIAYNQLVGSGPTQVALVMGDVGDGRPVLVRMHSECLTGDVFGSLRCDCGEQLHAAMAAVAAEGRGVVCYLRQEGRGIGLANKVRAYALQDGGLDTVEANLALGLPPDARDYGIGAQILADLGVREIRLLTNNPGKEYALAGFGLRIVERIPLQVPAHPENARYLATKRTKLGHLLP